MKSPHYSFTYIGKVNKGTQANASMTSMDCKESNLIKPVNANTDSESKINQAISFLTSVKKRRRGVAENQHLQSQLLGSVSTVNLKKNKESIAKPDFNDAKRVKDSNKSLVSSKDLSVDYHLPNPFITTKQKGYVKNPSTDEYWLFPVRPTIPEGVSFSKRIPKKKAQANEVHEQEKDPQYKEVFFWDKNSPRRGPLDQAVNLYKTENQPDYRKALKEYRLGLQTSAELKPNLTLMAQTTTSSEKMKRINNQNNFFGSEKKAVAKMSRVKSSQILESKSELLSRLLGKMGAARNEKIRTKLKETGKTSSTSLCLLLNK